MWVNICSRVCADCNFGSGGSVLVITMEEEEVGVCSAVGSAMEKCGVKVGEAPYIKDPLHPCV